MKVKNKNNRKSYIEQVSGVYWHIIPTFGDYPEHRKKIGSNERLLIRYMKRKGLTTYGLTGEAQK